LFSFLWLIGPSWSHGFTFRVFAITLRHTTLSRTPSERVISPSQRPLPDINTALNKRQTSMAPAGFGTTISASKRQQNHPLDRVATGISMKTYRAVELQFHFILNSKPEVRSKLHIPASSTHTDKVSGNHWGQQSVWTLKRAVITSWFLVQIVA